MRKITLLLYCLIVSYSVKAQFPEGFEGATFPPTGWASFIGTNGEGTDKNWGLTTTIVGAGNQSAWAEYEGVANEAEDWLVTPQFTPTSTKFLLSFLQRQAFSQNYSTTYTVRVSTASQTSHADFTVIDTQTEADFNTVYSEKTIDLTSYIGQPIYVAFVMAQNDGDNWYIDDVNLVEKANPPMCAENASPVNGATNVPVNNGAITISWNPPSSGDAPSSYEIFWGKESGNLNSLGKVASTSVNITNSDYSTTYYWKIVPLNNGGSATGCSEMSFTTEAVPPPPTNDKIAGAIELTFDEGTACGSNGITGISNTQATDSGEGGTPSCGEYNGGDLWFKFTAPSSEVTLNVANLTGLTSVAGAYYSGTTTTLSEKGCTQAVTGWPWKLTGLTQGETYYLRMWDYLGDQKGTFDICGYYDSSTANIEGLLIKGFKSYPNPVTNELNLTANTAIKKVVIIDMLGKVVLEELPNITTTKVNTAKLNRGVYIVKIVIDDKVGTYKIVKK